MKETKTGGSRGGACILNAEVMGVCGSRWIDCAMWEKMSNGNFMLLLSALKKAIAAITKMRMTTQGMLWLGR